MSVNQYGEESRSLGVANSVSPPLYRSAEKRRIVAALQANSSLLVVEEAGCGKSVLGEAVVEELQALGFAVAIAEPATVKQTLTTIAEQLGVDTETLDGKLLTTQQLQGAIALRGNCEEDQAEEQSLDLQD